MGSWSKHIDDELAQIVSPLTEAGFEVHKMLDRLVIDTGMKYGDGVLMEVRIIVGLKTCGCGVYRYIPGKISECPSCGADLI